MRVKPRLLGHSPERKVVSAIFPEGFACLVLLIFVDHCLSCHKFTELLHLGFLLQIVVPRKLLNQNLYESIQLLLALLDSLLPELSYSNHLDCPPESRHYFRDQQQHQEKVLLALL